jgi:4-hydroxybenzoate polyprenyltransferase
LKQNGKFRALLATARIANVPSVVSNVCVGSILASISSPLPYALIIAAILFYVSGNFLNDWADRKWDALHRPERALSIGLFTPSLYLAIGIIGILLGFALTASYGLNVFLISLILVFLVLLYTIIHKHTPLSVVPMGLCRACLPVLGCLAMNQRFSPIALIPAAALLLYIIALSISARWESRGNIPIGKRFIASGMLICSGLIAASLPLILYSRLAWLGLIPFAIWLYLSLTKYRSPVPTHVSALLAGIPLVDWISLLPLALVYPSPSTSLAPLFLAPCCFVLGRALQRIAPAT